MLNAQITTRKYKAISRGVGMQTQIYAERAKNAVVWDVEGHRYIDLLPGLLL